MTVPVCPTAVWNQSFSILAGSTSNAGSTTTLISSPSDVSFDGYHNMYVADMNNHRIQRYPSGFVSSFFLLLLLFSTILK